ncbi:MAG: outer membrane beta-barrel protein [Methylocystis sp.]
MSGTGSRISKRVAASWRAILAATLALLFGGAGRPGFAQDAPGQTLKSLALPSLPGLSPLAPPAPPLFRTDAGATSPQASPSSDELRGSLPGSAPREDEPRQKIRSLKPYPPPRLHAGEPRRFKHDLPPLEAYKTSAVARRALRLRRAPADPAREAQRKSREAAPPSVAALPTLKAKPKPKPDPEPYGLLGIGVGSMRFSPFIETSGGYDTNPNRLPAYTGGGAPPNVYNSPVPSSLLRVDTGMKLRSDWARDDFKADLRLGYVDYLDNQPASRPDGAGSLIGRYDVTWDTAIDWLGRFWLDTQRPGAPALSSGLPNVTVTNRPIVLTAGTSLGVTQKFGRLDVSLRGAYDRAIFQNAAYTDGSTLNLASTDYNDYGLLGEVGYELTPDVKPFLKAAYDSRIHDSYLDPYGYARDSTGFLARGGVKLKFSELLTGEAAVGYAAREYCDPRLPPVSTPTLDGALVYTPNALTTMTLRMATTINETTLQGASAQVTHSLGFEIAHDLFRNLRFTPLGNFFENNYVGSSTVERGYNLGAKIDYKITRSIALKASYSHERLNSTAQNSNYQAEVFMAGVRVQP